MSATSQTATDAGQGSARRSGVVTGTWSAFLIGLPLSVLVLTVLSGEHFEGTLVQRYISHPIERIELVVFCCALGAMLGKLANVVRQRRACRREILPAWDGQPVPASEAGALLAHLSRLPGWLRRSWLGLRAGAVLDFVCRRRSAEQLDDHIRSVSDSDSMALEGSYSLIRFLAWALPILGFLGTVLGITEAIAGVTPEVLERSISSVTDGLALAFDTTGLALILTMIVMLLSFLTERAEQGVLEQVDQFTDQHLAHRFSRPRQEDGPYLSALKEYAEVSLRGCEALVRRQAELWASTLETLETRREAAEAGRQERLTRALEEALARSLAAHQKSLEQARQASEAGLTRLVEPMSAVAQGLSQQQQWAACLVESMQALAGTLAALHEGEGLLRRQQESLKHNLEVLTSVGAFEETLHALNAAVHLLSARLVGRVADRQAA